MHPTIIMRAFSMPIFYAHPMKQILTHLSIYYPYLPTLSISGATMILSGGPRGRTSFLGEAGAGTVPD